MYGLVCRKYSDVTEVTEFDSTSSNKSKDLNQSTASVEAKSGTTARSFFCACNFDADYESIKRRKAMACLALN